MSRTAACTCLTIMNDAARHFKECPERRPLSSHHTKRIDMAAARQAAETALRTLGKEELLYTHHGDVHAANGAYERLAQFFVDFAQKIHP